MRKLEWSDAGISTMMLLGDSPMDVSDWLRANPRNWRSSSSTEARGRDWDGGADWNETLRIAREGWQQGVIDLYAAVQAIPPANVTFKEQYDVAGERPDVGRFLSGEPGCMVRRGRQAKQRPVIHLVINGSGNAGITAAQYMAYGAAVCALVDRIEAAGRRVEIDVLFVATGLSGNSCAIGGWKVKAAEDPCNLADIAFSLAHPVAYRRFGFGLWERSPASWETWSYGSGRQLKQRDLDNMGAENAYIVPGISTAPTRSASAMQMMAFAIKQINEAAGEEIVSMEEGDAQQTS